MGKTKDSKAAKVKEVKSLSTVKSGHITKPSQTPSAKAKVVAKETASKVNGKKAVKAVKAAPPPSSDSESESGSDASESEEEAKPVKVANGKTNGAKKEVDSSDSDSDSSESEDSEDADSDDQKSEAASEDDSDDSESDEEEKPVVAKAVAAAKGAVNGAAKAVAKATVSISSPFYITMLIYYRRNLQIPIALTITRKRRPPRPPKRTIPIARAATPTRR